MRSIRLGLLLLLCTTGGCRMIGREPVSKDVADCRKLSQRGMSAMERGQWETAESLMVQAIKSSPTDVDARRQYAEILWHRKAPAVAVAQMEEAIRLADHEPMLLVRAGEMYLAMDRRDEARRRVRLALDIDPMLASAWRLRGRIHRAEGEYGLALADCQRAISLSPDDTTLMLECAELYNELRQPSRALCMIQSLKETYPYGEEPQQVLYLEGLSLAGTGRFTDAADSYVAAIRRAEPTAELFYRLAEAQHRAGRLMDADRALQEALLLQPEHGPSVALRQKIAGGGSDSMLR